MSPENSHTTPSQRCTTAHRPQVQSRPQPSNVSSVLLRTSLRTIFETSRRRYGRRFRRSSHGCTEWASTPGFTVHSRRGESCGTGLPSFPLSASSTPYGEPHRIGFLVGLHALLWKAVVNTTHIARKMSRSRSKSCVHNPMEAGHDTPTCISAVFAQLSSHADS